MKLLYTDGVWVGRAGPIQLLHLESKWYVAGPGFLCAVDGEEEGSRLIQRLETARALGEPLVNYLGDQGFQQG